MGMEVRHVSTKQCTMDLPTSKVADAVGNPVMVSAILNYRVRDAKRAMLHVENRVQYINTNAQAVLKQIVSQHSYDQLKADGTVELDDEQKVRIVTNLLTVSCSDTDATPT